MLNEFWAILQIFWIAIPVAVLILILTDFSKGGLWR